MIPAGKQAEADISTMQARNAKAVDMQDQELQAGDHPSLSAMIYSWLHTAILNGTLAPGQVLRQEELAAKFKTSRVPLREALQSLQAEGLVVLRPRRGYAVTSLNAQQLMGLLQMRILIEGYAGYVGTRRRTQADVKILANAVQEMEKLPMKLTRESHRLRWSSLNRIFHAAVFAPSGNEHLLQISANINAKLDPYIVSQAGTGAEQEISRAEHRHIFEAFAAGDAERVGVLSRLHCERAASIFVVNSVQKGTIAAAPRDPIIDLGPAVAMSDPPRSASEFLSRQARKAAKG
jgi:DNA-binding GntR family transcriptional regulator